MAATSAPGDAAPGGQAALPDPRRWLILAVIGLAPLMILLDTTITVHRLYW